MAAHEVLRTAPLFVANGKVEDYCGKNPLVPCRLTWTFSHSPTASTFVHDWHIDLWTNKIVVIILTVVFALIVRRIAHGLITKVTTRMGNGSALSDRFREKTKTIFDGSSIPANERRRQRADTMGSLLRSITSAVILGMVAFTVLGEVGLNLTPFLASASIVGVAVAFGAQNLVKDFLSGIFMLLEDQYGVGDVIDAGLAQGTVEEVTLRITKLRDINGVVWYVRNGTIQRIGNESQNWARVVLDVPVSVEEPLDRVQEALQSAADGMAADEEWASLILEQPSVWGVQELTGQHVVVRLTLKTVPREQGRIARELRARVKIAFDEAGIAVAAPSDA